MARSIVVERDGAVSSFSFAKIDRAKLYGRRRRVALDPSGAECTRASLTDDGSLLLRLGMTGQGYFDEEGNWLQHKELVGLDADGAALEQRGSTLGKAVPLEGPLKAQDLLDVRVSGVYALTADDIDSALGDRLLAGEIYRLPFIYRSAYRDSWAWLVAGADDQFYALIGQPVTPEWCAANELPEIQEDVEDDFDDELDFEMF